MFLFFLFRILEKTLFGWVKDIHINLQVAAALPWMSPTALEGDWRGSTRMPGASNWHIPLVCCKPHTGHTCYMYVAKNGISAPLPHIVWTQQGVPLSTCVSIPLPIPTCTYGNTHLQSVNARAHLLTREETQLQTHTGTASHFKTNWQMLVCRHTHTHTRTRTHTHTRTCK